MNQLLLARLHLWTSKASKGSILQGNYNVFNPKKPTHFLAYKNTSLLRYTQSNGFHNVTKQRFSWKRIHNKQMLPKRSYMAGQVTGRDSDMEYGKISTKELIKFMLGYVWPKDKPSIKVRVVGALSLLITAKALNIQIPYFFKLAVDKFSESGMDVPQAVFGSCLTLILMYGSARAGSSLCNELRDAVFASVAQRSIRNVACSLFKHLHDLDLRFHLNRQTGGLSKAIDRGTRGINFALRAAVFHIAPTFLEVSLVSGILWYTCGPQFALVTVSTLAAYAAWTFGITSWRTKYRIRMNRADGVIGNIAVDSLINYETVKYFNNEAYEVKRYDKVLGQYEDANLKTNQSLALLNFGQQFIFSTGLTSMMLLAAYGIKDGSLTVGDLVYVNGLLFQLSMPLNFLGTIYRDIKQAVIDMEAMFHLMHTKRDINIIENAPQINLQPENTSITFNNVSFGYDKEKNILENLSFHLESGQRIGIVGGSGSGKSTIIRLMYRFYDAQQGNVEIGGQDISKVDVDSLRRHISVVPQDTVLFHDTIYHNIAYGDLSATKEEVENAARMADVHDTILNMPKGYDTVVGERGLKLSGGEKQRIAIARAILKNPQIVLYDEATSSLDSITEEHILQAIRRITKDRTSVFIAHRLSTVMDCDTIYVLDKGQIAEQGTHHELLAQENSIYSHLWNSQNKLKN